MSIHKIPINEEREPGCLGEEIFREYRAGRMTKDEYDVKNAMLVADNRYDYKPEGYHAMPQQLLDYVNMRLSGRSIYNADLARRVGAWFRATIETTEMNGANLSLFTWSLEKISDKKLGSKVALIKTAMTWFERIHPPRELLEKVLRVKVLDARDRPKSPAKGDT